MNAKAWFYSQGFNGRAASSAPVSYRGIFKIAEQPNGQFVITRKGEYLDTVASKADAQRRIDRFVVRGC